MVLFSPTLRGMAHCPNWDLKTLFMMRSYLDKHHFNSFSSPSYTKPSTLHELKRMVLIVNIYWVLIKYPWFLYKILATAYKILPKYLEVFPALTFGIQAKRSSEVALLAEKARVCYYRSCSEAALEGFE